MTKGIAGYIKQQFDELLQSRRQALFAEPSNLRLQPITHGDLSAILEALIDAVGSEVGILMGQVEKSRTTSEPRLGCGSCSFCGIAFADETSDHMCDSELLRAKITALGLSLENYRTAYAKQEKSLRYAERRCKTLEEDLAFQKERRRTEREGLVEWLDRRIAQQEELLGKSYIGEETKNLVEIEVSILKKYRVIISEGKHRVEDPFAPTWKNS